MDLSFVHDGVFVAIIAHGLIGITLVWDKILLRQPETRNLVSYVFWLGFISIFGLVLIFFGFHIPAAPVIGIAFGAGLLQMPAMFFYYGALKAGEASQTLAIMGGFSPVATALISIPLLRNPIGGKAVFGGFLLLVLGGFVMFISEKTDVRKVLPNVLLASASYGLVNVLQKLAFDRTNFVSGYVFYAGHIFRSAPVAGATQVAASDFQEGEKEARSGGKAGVVLVFRESILERAWFVSCLLRHQPDAAGGGGRHYRRPVCRHFRRIVWADAAEAAIVARRFQRRRSFWQNGGHRTGGRRPGAHRLARRRRRVAKHAIAEKGGYHCSSTTPHATRVAAAQRRNPTFSLRMYLARNVSRT